MTLAQVIALINSEIIPNNNNEITANVLRPILLEMLQQPNDLIGNLLNLTTGDTSNIVNAINELKSDLSNVNEINIFQGVGNPNSNPPSGAVIADFYSQINVSSVIIDLWIYNGVEWIRLTDSYVSYDFPQPLSPSQQQQALDNINALSRTPNGTDNLIGTNNKINDVYLPDSLLGQLRWGGTFDENGIISATADYPLLNGTNIALLDTVQYKGVYFIAAFTVDTTYTLHGVDYNNGDWAVANGNIDEFNKADNSDAVQSVNGYTGTVVINISDIPNLSTQLSGKADKSTTITINGVTQDLSVNRTWTVNSVEWLVFSAGGQVSPTAQKTVVHIQPNDVVQIDDGIFDGQEVAIVVCGGADYGINGSVVDACGNQSTLTFSSGGNIFWWSESDSLWIQVT